MERTTRGPGVWQESRGILPQTSSILLLIAKKMLAGTKLKMLSNEQILSSYDKDRCLVVSMDKMVLYWLTYLAPASPGPV